MGVLPILFRYLPGRGIGRSLGESPASSAAVVIVPLR